MILSPCPASLALLHEVCHNSSPLSIMDFVRGTAQIFLFLDFRPSIMSPDGLSQHANPILGAFEYCDSPEVIVATSMYDAEPLER